MQGGGDWKRARLGANQNTWQWIQGISIDETIGYSYQRHNEGSLCWREWWDEKRLPVLWNVYDIIMRWVNKPRAGRGRAHGWLNKYMLWLDHIIAVCFDCCSVLRCSKLGFDFYSILEPYTIIVKVCAWIIKKDAIFWSGKLVESLNCFLAPGASCLKERESPRKWTTPLFFNIVAP